MRSRRNIRAYNQPACGKVPLPSNSIDGHGRPARERLPSAMARSGVVLILLLCGGMVRADGPVPTAAGTVWQYALTREPGPATTTTITRKVLPSQDVENQPSVAVETVAEGVPESTEFLKIEGE